MIATLLGVMMFGSAVAQNNKGYYYSLTEGHSVEYAHYDKKNKLTAHNKQTVKKIVNTPKGIKATINSEYRDEKGKVFSSGDVYVKIENDVYYFDIRNVLDPRTLEVFGENEVEITGKELELPKNISVGQHLPDAEVSIKIKMSDVPLPPMRIRVYDREVIGQEKITTSAGTFQCYKIESQMEIKNIITTTVKTKEWVAEGVGVVKSETFNKKGKLLGSMLLNEMK